MELEAKLRNQNKKAKNFIKEGDIPAILYGKDVENIPLSVNQKEFEKILKEAGESTIINLIIEKDGKREAHPVLIYDIQEHYLTHKPIHIDFYQVKKGQKIKAHIPIEFIGEAPAVKILGGILVKNLDEIEVEGLPQDLPHIISVDISKLDTLESKISLKDLNISKKVKVFTSPETIVVSIVLPQEEEVSIPESPTEVKIEGEEKKSEKTVEEE
ncbi:MAG: 50S ribosomal protein L25 [Parcubacteria group bacterium]|nr:50S ribosomal protein L25 [Parcubacteria group bacterium]